MNQTERTPEQILDDISCGVFLPRKEWRRALAQLEDEPWTSTAKVRAAIHEALGDNYVEGEKEDGA